MTECEQNIDEKINIIQIDLRKKSSRSQKKLHYKIFHLQLLDLNVILLTVSLIQQIDFSQLLNIVK
jgi:hypothetical protein